MLRHFDSNNIGYMKPQNLDNETDLASIPASIA